MRSVTEACLRKSLLKGNCFRLHSENQKFREKRSIKPSWVNRLYISNFGWVCFRLTFVKQIRQTNIGVET